MSDPVGMLGRLADPSYYKEAITPQDRTLGLIALRKMMLIRKAEERIAQMVLDGEAKCPCHLAVGQEAVAVGVAQHLSKIDSVFGAHRSHAHYLALGAPLDGLFAEILGKETGCSKGMGGSMHLYARDQGFAGSVPIVGGTVSLAAGAGLAAKFKKNNAVGVAYFGDGACEEGVVQETLNAARIMELPTLFIVENNLFSSHLDLAFRQPFDSMARFAQINDMAYRVVDGNDPFAVADATEDLLEISRKGAAVFLETVTYRHLGHVGPDPNVDVGVRRSAEELAAWKNRDPILRLKAGLIDLGALNDQDFTIIEDQICDDINIAYERAVVAPYPSDDALLDRVYSGSMRSVESLPQADVTTKKMSYCDAIREAHEFILQHIPEAFVMGQGVWSPWYVGASMKDLDRKFGKDRVIDTPVSENACTGIAVGASLEGMRPIIMHPRIDFMLYAMDPVVNQAAKWGHMLGGQSFPATTIRGIINRGGEQGAQHSQSLHSWFAHIPGLRVILPATVTDARDLLIASVLSDDPVIYMDDRWLYEEEAEVPVQSELLDLSKIKPQILQNGSDLTIVASSYSTKLACETAEQLSCEGISAEIIDLRTINPLNYDLLVTSVEKTGRLACIDGSWLHCGMSAEIIAGVTERLSPSMLKASPVRIGLQHSPAPTSKALEKLYYPSVDAISQTLKARLHFT